MDEQITETIIEDQTIVGDSDDFAIGYAFIGEDRITEISMYVGDANILGFVKGGTHCTLRWAYLEGLLAWLKGFACNMKEDPFPVDVEGEFASERIANALGSGPEDEDEFAEYVDPIWDWVGSHSWVSERGGAILSHVYFELKDGMVEVSWDNRNPRDGVAFDCELGGDCVSATVFKDVVLEFVDAYETHWGIRIDDDSTWTREK